MAEQVPGKPTPPGGEQPPAQEREIPSFTEATREAQASRTRELHERTGTKPEGDAPPPERKPGEETPYDGRAEWEKLPENLRGWATQRLYEGYNAALEERYGDVLPLLVEINQNPNLRATFAEAAKDPELRDLLSDPSARDQIKRLTQKELREFLFGEALQAYEKYPTATPRQDERDPRDARLDELTQKFESTENRRERETYVATRGQEVRALQSAFPQLSGDQIAHVVTLSEERFEAAANRAGIRTRDERGAMLPDWAGEAVRKGIRPPQYREYAAQYAEVIGRGSPPAAPAPGTTPVGEPGEKSPQAPRDTIEARRNAGVTAMRELRAKHPAFSQRRNR